MGRRYSPSSYDDYMCLKPPLLLWLAVIYLSRAVTLPIVLGIGSLGGGGWDIRAFAGAFLNFDTLAPSLIAALVLCAMVRRVPSGSRLLRRVWAHGRVLLVAAALLDFGLALLSWTLHGTDVDHSGEATLLAAGLDLYFAAYVLTTRRVRDVFAEFPLEAGPAGK